MLVPGNLHLMVAVMVLAVVEPANLVLHGAMVIAVIQQRQATAHQQRHVRALLLVATITIGKEQCNTLPHITSPITQVLLLLKGFVPLVGMFQQVILAANLVC
jgi:hypothetical protein